MKEIIRKTALNLEPGKDEVFDMKKIQEYLALGYWQGVRDYLHQPFEGVPTEINAEIILFIDHQKDQQQDFRLALLNRLLFLADAQIHALKMQADENTLKFYQDAVQFLESSKSNAKTAGKSSGKSRSQPRDNGIILMRDADGDTVSERRAYIKKHRQWNSDLFGKLPPLSRFQNWWTYYKKHQAKYDAMI